MEHIYEAVGDVLSGRKSIREIKKQLEKAAIKAFYAPSFKTDRKAIVKDYDGKNSTLAASTKSSVTGLTYQMDSAIKGKGATAIANTLKEHVKDFDSI